MIRTSSCLSDPTLQQYLEGWTEHDVLHRVEQHLSQCKNCENRLEQVESQRVTDGLLESLRQRNQMARGTQQAGGMAVAEGQEPRLSSDFSPEMASVSDLASAASSAGGPDEQASNRTPADEPPGDEPSGARFQRVLAEIQHWPLGDTVPAIAPSSLPQTLGQYELLELIGQGGMAQVFRARHHRLQRSVAVKLLNVPAWQADRSLARLEREIAVVGQLHHPAIVAATDAGQHDGVPYLVTEFIDGLNLSQLARAAAPNEALTTANACEAIRVAALGLAHAHSQGITHRDIKPSNLMVDRQGQVKILDFGLVHLDGWQDEALELTTVGQLLGTLDYMAPEQADKATAVDHRSDVYALGATLFRLLCGRAPYAASLHQSPLEKLRLLALTDPPQVRTLRPDLPNELAALVDQSLQRDPGQRPPSAAHFAQSLAPFCGGADLADWVQKALESRQSVAGADGASLLSLKPHGLGRSSTGQANTRANTQANTQAESSDRGRRWWPWFLAAAAGAAAIWLGITVILENQKGQLVIESESANVRVTLRQDGQASETLQLQPGVNQTRVMAGTYQIEIEGAADQYELDRDSVVIKRGEVVLAKVTQKPPAIDTRSLDADESGMVVFHPHSEPPPALPRSNADEPTYKGYPFSHWAAIFRNERDTKLRLEALACLQTLAESEELRDRVVELIANLIVDSQVGETQHIASILVRVRQVYPEYSLTKKQWARIQTVIESAKADRQPEMLRQLSDMLPKQLDTTNQNFARYMDLSKTVAEQYSHQWSVESKERFIDIYLAWLNPINQDRSIDQQITAGAVKCLQAGNLDQETWVRIAKKHPIEYSPVLSQFAISALIGDETQPFRPTQESAEQLIALRKLTSHTAESERTVLAKRISLTLSSLTRQELLTPIAGYARSEPIKLPPNAMFSDTLSMSAPSSGMSGSGMMMSGRILGSSGSNLSSVAGLGAGGEDTSDNSRILTPWHPAVVEVPTNRNSPFVVSIETSPTFGEVLAAIGATLKEATSVDPSNRIETLIQLTAEDYNSFWRTVVDHQDAEIPLQVVNIHSDKTDLTGVYEDIARRAAEFPSLANTPESQQMRYIELTWTDLDLDPAEGANVGDRLMGRYRFTDAMDRNKDGKVSQEELYIYMSGKHPPKVLEEISSEQAQGMLLHHFLLTVLERPIPPVSLKPAATGTTEELPAEEGDTRENTQQP